MPEDDFAFDAEALAEAVAAKVRCNLEYHERLAEGQMGAFHLQDLGALLTKVDQIASAITPVFLPVLGPDAGAIAALVINSLHALVPVLQEGGGGEQESGRPEAPAPEPGGPQPTVIA